MTKKSWNLLGPKKITQPLGTNNSAPSCVKKKSRNLLGSKISKPLRTKPCNLFRQKKSHNLLGQKKTEPLRTNKSYNLSGPKKNHATFWDEKKIMQPLGTKKSRILSGQKKVGQPLGTKKKLYKLSGQKNHATSQDKKKSRNLSGQKLRSQ